MNAFWYDIGSVPTVHADQHHLYFVPGSSTLFVGNDGGVYRTTNGGVNWSWIGSGLKITQFYRLGLSATGSSLILAGSQDNGTKRYNGSWADVSGGDGMECIIDPDNASIMYVSMQRGILQRSTNGGNSFRRINDANSDGEYDDINEGGAWVTPYMLHPTNSSTLFAGFVNVWRSTDSGTNFTRISDFGGTTKLRNLTVAPSNADIIYASTSSRMNRTTDGGASWAQTTRPGTGTITSITVHPDLPLTVWATTSGYTSGQKVFHSTDGGGNWANISGSLPNVPANCLAYQNNSNNRIYVGTDIGVYYRDTTMNDWTAFNSGLPNVIISELEIRGSTNDLVAATFGRGLWQISLNSVLPTPVLLLPENSSKNLETNSIALVWESAPNATSYQLQVSISADFDSFIIDQSNLTDTIYMLNGLSYYTKYYWRVKASAAGAASAWPSAFDFTTKLPAPVLVSPANFSNAIGLSGQLSWQSVGGATSYGLMLSDTNDFSNVILQDNDINTTALDYSGLANFNNYYWRVQSGNAGGDSDWSQTFGFVTMISIPVLSSPANNITGLQYSGIFIWDSVDGASSYDIEVSKNPGFNDLVISEPNINAASLAYDKLDSFTIYYWRVRANGTNEISGWSEVWNLRTKFANPKLLAPDSNSVAIELNGLLEWEEDAAVEYYAVQIAADSTFDDIILHSEDDASPEIAFSGLNNNTIYYWRVRKTSGAEYSRWSNIWKFTTELSQPLLQSPPDNADSVGVDIELTWLPVHGAGSYLIQLSDNFGMQNLIIQRESGYETRYEIDGMEKNKTYYWRAKAYSPYNDSSSINDKYTNRSQWSVVWRFSTERDVTLLDSPPDNSGAEPVAGKLRWKGITGVPNYRMQISTDNSFVNTIADIGGIGQAEYDYSGLDNYEQYFWRAGAEYDDGTVVWSEVWSFTTVIAEPEQLMPPDNAAGISLSGYLQWALVAGAANYSVQLSANIDFNVLIIDVGNISEANIQYQNLDYSGDYYWRVKAHNAFGESGWPKASKFTTKSVNSTLLAADGTTQLALKAYPNPFNNTTIIKYTLDYPTFVYIIIYDHLGSKIKTMKQYQDAGERQTIFKADKLNSGVYYYTIQTGERIEGGQLLLIK